MCSKIVETGTYFDPETRIWTGPKLKMQSGADASLGRCIVESLLKLPDHIAQICANNGKQYTNEQILTMSIRIAQHLEDIGIQQEDVIGICASNTDFLAPLVFGSLLCGTIISTLDPSFDKDGVRHIFSITKPKIMFCDGGEVYQIVKESLAEIDPSIPIYTIKNHFEGVRRIEELIVSTGKEASFIVKPLKRGSSQTALILCSSGTTGLPKGVCMSHESLMNSLIFSLNPDDKLLGFSTIYWVSGIICLVHGTMNNCTRVITDQKFSPELFLKIIEQYKITAVFTPPSQMAMAVQCPDISKRDLRSLLTYICGGSAVPFAVVQEFSQHVKDCQMIIGYGMSELSGGCCFGIPTKAGENGKLMPNMTVKIIDDNGKQLGIGEMGEICIKSPFNWAGYLGNPTATSQIYHQDGYIYSGDIGYFDESGSLLIVDRKKDIMKYNNFHFSPSEIEEVIIQIPDVVEVCVCGIPDIISSFLPAAAVVKVPGSSLTENDIAQYVAERMAHFKHLHGGVYFLDSLPKTASGKNIRAKVTKILESLYDQRKEKSFA
ncbi:probable 4-coumarate--CoA ligase 3 [Episyrphus balteatus]|uniref:probable 4-coumarate--CoA ligase 3 n=1 Tax=Episyrphus balteatus TaxID=286459 RepID=UPI0024868487|nr:probable 4-coumarate--CoA ligase 3 [Episyrphus balteatus]